MVLTKYKRGFFVNSRWLKQNKQKRPPIYCDPHQPTYFILLNFPTPLHPLSNPPVIWGPKSSFFDVRVSALSAKKYDKQEHLISVRQK